MGYVVRVSVGVKFGGGVCLELSTKWGGPPGGVKTMVWETPPCNARLPPRKNGSPWAFSHQMSFQTPPGGVQKPQKWSKSEKTPQSGQNSLSAKVFSILF